MRILVGVVLFLAAAASCAQDVQAWGANARLGYARCSFIGAAAMIIGRVRPEDIEEARDCVEARIGEVKSQYQALPPQRKPAATAALNDFYAAWIAAMRSVPSRLAQSKANADASQAATKQRLDELWARFEIEAGI